MNPYLLLGIGIAFVLNGFYWNAHGSNAMDTAWKAKTYQSLAESSEAARKQESMWQGVVNETSKNLTGKLAGVQRNLGIALDGLRSRPERPNNMPEATRSSCKGSTGAELSRPDAEFLARESSRADEQRAGLVSCYEVIDAMK